VRTACPEEAAAGPPARFLVLEQGAFGFEPGAARSMERRVRPLETAAPERQTPMTEASTALETIRRQLTIVRALADEIERCLPEGIESSRDQLAEELARLGCQCLETGAAMARQPRS